MKKNCLIVLLTLCPVFCIQAQPNVSDISDPLAVVRLIGDKLVRDTPFNYRLTLQGNNSKLNGLQFVDFGRTFGQGKPAVAYAYTQLTSADDTEITLQTAHNDGCKIWVNSGLVYEKQGRNPLNLRFEERSVEMDEHFTVKLKKGANNMLIKSETYGNEWVIYFQPPSSKGAVVTRSVSYPEIGLKSVPGIDQKIAGLTNWLVIGPFANPDGKGIGTVYAPEKEIVFGKMYEGAVSPVTWTIPKIEILGDFTDPLPWGTNYTWNYHNGGVAWAMEQLAEVTGDAKYNQYATNFCDFHINGAPFVNYQVKTLRAVNSANNGFLFSPLLDFTLAPALPFIYKLRKEPSFGNRDLYIKYIDRMMKYAKDEQVRFPGSNIYTRLTPEKYTTWVDDMFMGIPFLVQAAQYASTPEERKQFLDDAANQAVRFNEQVWDKEARLYMHAKYSEKDVKLPHWSRANGWGIWATTEVLKVLPKNHPNYKILLAHYREHVDALVALQNKNGFWLQVLDRPDSREEVSGTAIFTMAIARGVTNGWLNAKKYRPFVQKGWEALKTQIEPNGTVHNICYGTMCSEDVNYYLERPFYDNDTHGL
ncbi:MAG TPA: glycoside hydrolase family 88 protein, partial [Prolixibacteraceae bacterium]|nr:glycoside hydrolase family 88 protein [Prolixibacteraceae bacterium]